MAGDHAQPFGRSGSRGMAGNVRGRVAAIVINQDDAPGAAIILRQQRADALPDHLGFVARGHHRGDARPVRRLR